MGPSPLAGGGRRVLLVVLGAASLLVGGTVEAFAEWPQFQGDGGHTGLSDGPSAPLAVAWRVEDLELAQGSAVGGLAPPVVADDGTIVTVGPREVLGFSADDGAERFRADRDFGPSVTAAIADGTDGPIVIYTEGYGDDPPGTASPTGSASPSPTPSPGDPATDEAFDSHVKAVDLDGRPAWEEPAQLDAIVITPVTVDGGAAYVGDLDGNVTALDAATGEPRWTVDAGTTLSGAVTVDGDRLYVSVFGSQTAAGAIVALDAATGEELWRTTDEDVVGNVVSAPVLAERSLVVLETSRAASSVVAIDPADGALRWRSDVVNPMRNPAFFFQGPATPTPVAAGDAVVALDVSGRAYAFDAGTGEPRWDHALNDPSLLSVPIVTDRHLLVPTDSGTVAAIDLDRGHLVWRVDTDATLLRGLADAGDILVAVTGFDGAGLIAFGPGEGALLDEPSPTTFDAGDLALGFLLGGAVFGAAVVLLFRPLQRRFVRDDDAGDGIEEDDVDGDEGR